MLKDNTTNTNKGSWVALLPLMTFILIYLGISLAMGDFYKVPIAVAFLMASVVSIITIKGRTITERVKIFSRGASSENMMLMIWIFILAGAFASSAKAMGCIDNTVNLALTLFPSNMIMASIFVAACFISISVGTSVGTIVALVPIASGLATATGSSIELMTGIVVGGAFFGDNLSFISDTTVVATQTQGCRMSDKFRANIFIVAPAAIVTLLIYIIIGKDLSVPSTDLAVDYIKVIPYVAVLVAAVCGLNVMVVLIMGIALTGILGTCTGTYDAFGWMQHMSDGILSMSELIIVTMLAGGMLEVVRHNGGINLIIKHLTNHISSRRGGEAAIAFLVVIVNFCTANNTVTIITVGPIARNISECFGIDPRRTASILDTFSCFAQGTIPYGAQLLMAGGLAAITPVSIIPYLLYTYAIGIAASVAIITGRPRRLQ